MDNIAQSMRFSPTPNAIYRNLKPELAFAANQSKFTVAKVGQGALRGL